MVRVLCVRLRRSWRLSIGVLLVSATGCASRGEAVTASASEPPQVQSGTRPAAGWERLVDGRYENKGIARIEKVGDRWALSVLCRGTHTTYLDESAFDLTRYQNLYVAVRYDYVDRTVPNPKCVRAPCPPMTERRILLERITPVPVTREQADERARQCK